MKNIRNLLFLLYLIYAGKGSLYAEGTIISKISLILFLCISAFYFLKISFSKIFKSLFYKMWTSLMLLFVIGYVFTGNYANKYHFSLISGILITSLTFYPFYYFALRGVLQAKHLLYFFAILLPMTILQYYLNADKILSERIAGNTDLVNNVAYSFVGLIPFTFLIKKNKILSFGIMFILMFFIIQGAKRGALLTGSVCLILFIYFHLKTVSKKFRFRSYIVIFIALLALIYFSYDLFEHNAYLISRIQDASEGDSSGRDEIYRNIFTTWYYSDNLIHLLFGYGFAGSLIISGRGLFAHNDWLELLANFGILGVTTYFFLFYSAFKQLWTSKWKIDKKLMTFTLLISWFLITLVSMFYTVPNSYIQVILLAYIFGNKSNLLI